MAKGFFKLTGFDEYLDKIALAGKDIDQAAENAVVVGGDVLKEGMQERAPKDEHDLENAIVRTEPERDGNFVFVEVGVIGANADITRYGTAQEFGSSSMEAQPYVRSTVDRDAAKMRRAQRASLEKDGVL
jgi:HK97 gp10 family phage protein